MFHACTENRVRESYVFYRVESICKKILQAFIHVTLWTVTYPTMKPWIARHTQRVTTQQSIRALQLSIVSHIYIPWTWIGMLLHAVREARVAQRLDWFVAEHAQWSALLPSLLGRMVRKKQGFHIQRAWGSFLAGGGLSRTWSIWSCAATFWPQSRTIQ